MSRKTQRDLAKDLQRAEKDENRVTYPSSNDLKRKRSDVDESDAKLKEFLQVMLPKSKTKALTRDTVGEEAFQEPPTKVQAVELPECDSDGEYEMVPKKGRKEEIRLKSPPPTNGFITEVKSTLTKPTEVHSETPIASTVEPVSEQVATDDDWLRSRTNRLLDLVDANDITTVKSCENTTSEPSNFETRAFKLVELDSNIKDVARTLEDVDEDQDQDSQTSDPISDAIRTNGRLFVRNLPYSASEDELRQHFEPYGNLAEVWPFQVHSSIPAL